MSKRSRYSSLLVALTGGVVVGVPLGVVARRHARRLVRPLQDLVAAAEMQRLNAERQFAADTSHQLRTPLTALSIRLEEIAATTTQPEVREEATAALAACERLTAVVDTLLAQHGHANRESAEIAAVDDVLFAQRVEWHPAFQRADREMVVRGVRGLKARVSPPVLSQVVATLVDNALAHGRGTVSLRTRSSGGHVVVEVGDEGAGIPDVLVPHIFERAFSGSTSTGLGLSLARDLIEAEGGRLELIASRPPVFAVFLKPDADQAR
jgi:signal transduction histidine kinase